jgi:hypothetical protein
MTLRVYALLLLTACARGSTSDAEIARARIVLDQALARMDGPVVDPPEARELLLTRGEALSACAPARLDLGILVDRGGVIAFDRALRRDPAVEACVRAALAPLEGPVAFVPATLPGGRPQILRVTGAPSRADPAIDAFDPALELTVLVEAGAPPDRVERTLAGLRDRGFRRLALRVLE